MTIASSALGTPEIIYEILRPLCICSERNLHHLLCAHHLFPCILVSKTWFRVAIPLLWSLHAGLGNIMSLMYDESSLTRHKRMLVLPSRLERLFFYSKFCKCLSPIRLIHIENSLPAFLVAVASANGETLLPHLQRLYSEEDWLSEDMRLAALSAILSPSVKDINLIAPREPNLIRLHNFLHVVQTRAPELEVLTLNRHPRDSTVAKEILAPFLSNIATFTSIHSVTLPVCWLSAEGFVKLATLPHLQLLDLGNLRNLGERATIGNIVTKDPNSSRQFPALEILGLGGEWGTLINILQSAFNSDHTLRVLSLTYFDKPFDVATCPDLISLNFPHLETLFIDANAQLPDAHLRFDLLKTLTNIRTLTELSLHSCELENRELIRLLRLWPNLKDLSLTGTPGEDVIHGIGFALLPTYDFSNNGLHLDCLGDIAVLCPRLELLKVSVVASQTSGLIDMNTGGAFANLKSLTFVSSFLSFKYPTFCIKQAAQYIGLLLREGTKVVFDDQLTSAFTGVDYAHKYEDAYHLFGDKLRDLVSLAVSVRMDEHARMNKSK